MKPPKGYKLMRPWDEIKDGCRHYWDGEWHYVGSIHNGEMCNGDGYANPVKKIKHAKRKGKVGE